SRRGPAAPVRLRHVALRGAPPRGRHDGAAAARAGVAGGSAGGADVLPALRRRAGRDLRAREDARGGAAALEPVLPRVRLAEEAERLGVGGVGGGGGARDAARLRAAPLPLGPPPPPPPHPARPPHA